MSTISNIEDWGNSHRPGWLDFFRIVLGVFITVKGFEFMFNIESLKLTAAGMNLAFSGQMLAHYIIFAHALGGPLIAFGLFTRIVCLIQLPILVGAVLVNFTSGFFADINHMELAMSLITLVGLVTFIVFGAGKFSIDEKRRKEMKAAH